MHAIVIQRISNDKIIQEEWKCNWQHNYDLNLHESMDLAIEICTFSNIKYQIETCKTLRDVKWVEVFPLSFIFFGPLKMRV